MKKKKELVFYLISRPRFQNLENFKGIANKIQRKNDSFSFLLIFFARKVKSQKLFLPSYIEMVDPDGSFFTHIVITWDIL